MAKQAFANKTHAKMAWHPLREWIFNQADPETIFKFNKTNSELHTVVAKCLWELATAVNHPWGVAGTQPNGYSIISVASKKVVCDRIYIRLGPTVHVVFVVACLLFFFFYSLVFGIIIYEHRLYVHSHHVHMCDMTGLGVCLWGTSDDEQGTFYEHGKF